MRLLHLRLLSIEKKLDAKREADIQIMYIHQTKLSDYTRSKLRSILSSSLSLDIISVFRSSHSCSLYEIFFSLCRVHYSVSVIHVLSLCLSVVSWALSK